MAELAERISQPFKLKTESPPVKLECLKKRQPNLMKLLKEQRLETLLN